MTVLNVIDGDCLEVMRSLPDQSIDAVITDPPYCSGGFNETARRQATGQGLRSETIRRDGWFTSDNMGTSGLVWLLRQVAVEAFRLLRPGSSLLVFTDWRQLMNVGPALESVGFRLSNIVVWDKGTPGLGMGFRAQHEMVLHLTTASAKYHDVSIGNVIRAQRISSAAREHQTQKPVELLRKLIRVAAPSDGVVLDPFCGSGTTGVACVEEGRSFIGIERDRDYAALARRRIADATAQFPLFAPEAA